MKDIERVFKHESRSSREVVLSRQIEGLGNFVAASSKSTHRRIFALTVLVVLDLIAHALIAWR